MNEKRIATVGPIGIAHELKTALAASSIIFTLALAPIYVVLAFQFVFLPYHSHLVTWTHRLLLLVELTAAFLLWPLVLDARRDFN